LRNYSQKYKPCKRKLGHGMQVICIDTKFLAGFIPIG